MAQQPALPWLLDYQSTPYIALLCPENSKVGDLVVVRKRDVRSACSSAAQGLQQGCGDCWAADRPAFGKLIKRGWRCPCFTENLFSRP